MKNLDVIKDLYKDIVDKRNKYKIELDDYTTEVEIIKKSLDYRKSKEDDSKFFSPRSNDNGIESVDELDKKLEKYEKLTEEVRNNFEYYDGYCQKLSEFLNNEKYNVGETKVTGSLDSDISYSLNLNYDINDIESKISAVQNRIEFCLNIFDNDRERTKNELKEIKRMIDNMMEIF
jgi:hypothetical protein